MHVPFRRQAVLLATLATVAICGIAPGQEPAEGEAPAAPPERTIYVPYRNLAGVFDNLGASVVMPYSEWIELWRKRIPDGAPRRPVEAVITAATYSATVEKDIARIKARLTINVLGEPWVEVPIRFGEAAVGKLEGGDKVLLRGTGDGAYALLLGTAGEQQVSLELVARVRTSPDGREFSFEVPPVGITSLEVTVPEADQTVEISPRLVSQPVEDAAAGATRVMASVGSTGRISAKWHPRVSSRPEMDLLASVTNLTQVSVEDGLIHTDAYLTFDILRGGLDQLRIIVPADHRILDVSAAAKLKGWRAEPGADGGPQIVIVEFLSSVEKQVQVEVHTERKLPDEPFDVAGRPADDAAATAGIHAPDAVRESGQIVLRSSADLALAITEQQGLVRIEAGQTAERIRSEGATAFKYYTPRFTLRAAAKPVEPRLVVNHTAQVVFHEDEVRLDAALNYTVERAGVFQLVLGVPEGLVVDDVQCPAMKEFNVDAANTLTISLNEKTQGHIPVAIKAHQPFQAGVDQTPLTLPLLEPRQVEREIGAVYLFARESIEVVTNDEQLVAAQPLPAPPGARAGDAVLTAAWSFTRRPVTIPVTTKRKAARLNVDVATRVNVLPQSTEVRTRLDYQVQFAAIDTFQFQVPTAVSGLLQVEVEPTDATTPAIKQKTASDPQDGWVTWTVVMQREVLGLLRLVATYDLKSDAEAGAATAAGGGARTDEFSIDLVKPLPAPESQGRAAVPLSRLRGEVSVSREQALAVTASAAGGDIEAIDVRELSLLPQDGSLAYRYFQQPDTGSVRLNVTRTRHEIEEVVATVVRRALVEIVNGEDGTAIYHVRMRVRSTERQRLLVDLPANLELIGVSVEGREVKLERAGAADEKARVQSYYIPVTRPQAADTEFLISFQFRWNVSPHLGESEFLRGGLELPLPVLGGQDAQAAVQELRVAVWVPRKYALVGEPANFSIERQPRLFSALTNTTAAVSDDELDGWIGGSDVTLSPAKKGLVGYVYSNLGGERRVRVVWWNRIWMTMIVSITIAIIAWVLGRTNWENKLWVLLVATFILALLALWDVDWVAHAISAARFGLVFLVGWWLVSSFFALRRPPAAVAVAGTGGGPSVTSYAAASPPPGAIEEARRQADEEPK